MDELTEPDNKRRSRSKTPFVLRSHCDKDNCTEGDHLHTHPVKKAPTVKTIIEEKEQSPGPATSSSTRTTRKIITSAESSNHNNNAEPNTKKNINSLSTENNQISSTFTTTNIIVTSSTVESSAASSSSSDTKQITSTRPRRAANPSSAFTASTTTASTKEVSQNILNKIFEEARTSTPILRSPNTSDQNISTSVGSNGNLSLSYKEYQDAGEYWNKYPKTDYTYSKLSSHRREIAPGVVAMPNMSRPSLALHYDRVDVMVQKNPAQESYIRSRYLAKNSERVQKTTAQKQQQYTSTRDVYYDSQDELDAYEEHRYRHKQYISVHQRQNIVTRVFTTIITWIMNSCYNCTKVFRRSNQDIYTTRIEQQGWFSKFLSALTMPFLAIFRYMYLFISSVLCLDSWLLKSSNPHNKTKKRFLLLLLILLPLLLLTGAYYYFEKPFPDYSISFDHIFDPVRLEYFKSNTVQKFDDFKYISELYWNNLKIFSHNVWKENFNF